MWVGVLLGGPKESMSASFFKEGSRVNFDGLKGTVIKITETYRKNVLVVKVDSLAKKHNLPFQFANTVGLFEYPDGTLSFMNVID